MVFKKPPAEADLNSFINGGEAEPKTATARVEPEDNAAPISEGTSQPAEAPAAAPATIDSSSREQEVQPIRKSNRGRKPKSAQAEVAENEEKEQSGSNKTIFSQNDEDFEAFRNYAFMKRMTKTSIIRKALKEYMENHP